MAPSRPGAAIPDLTGLTAVVTGASGGIGLEVARGLAGNGAHAVLGVRSADRGQSAASSIWCTSARAALEVMTLDLADLASNPPIRRSPAKLFPFSAWGGGRSDGLRRLTAVIAFGDVSPGGSCPMALPPWCAVPNTPEWGGSCSQGTGRGSRSNRTQNLGRWLP